MEGKKILLVEKFVLDYSHSSHSGHAQRGLKMCISSRWACQTGCWVLGWAETQPASYEPVKNISGKRNSTLLRFDHFKPCVIKKRTWFLCRPIRRTQSTYRTSTLYIISWTIFMDWGSLCLRGLVAKELSSDDSKRSQTRKATVNLQT